MDAIYPPTCPVCSKPIAKSQGERKLICDVCKPKMSYINTPRCLKCGKSIDDDEVEYCFDCMKTKHLYTRGVGVFSYTKEIKYSIYRFKYKNKREYAKFYGSEIADKFSKIIYSWNAEVLLPVPLHNHKKKVRGYNQTELIANEVGKLLNIPVDTFFLKRIKKTVPQKELDDKGRRKNVESAFKISDSVVKYKKVIIIDDIYTTGTTIDACADVLLKAGVEKVYFICLCIGEGF